MASPAHDHDEAKLGSRTHDDDELELQRFEQMCLPSWDKFRSQTFALRPERPEYQTLAGLGSGSDGGPNQIWRRVLRRLRAGLLSADGSSLEELHAAMSGNRADRFELARPALVAAAATLYELEVNHLDKFAVQGAAEAKKVLEENLGQMRMYDPEITGNLSQIKWAVGCVAEHKLLADYSAHGAKGFRPARCNKLRNEVYWNMAAEDLGCWANFWEALTDIGRYIYKFAACCESTRPSPNHFLVLSRILTAISPGADISDFATFLAQFSFDMEKYPGDKPLDWSSVKYRPVLADLIANMAEEGGRDRLIRKLSVDVNEMIPALVGPKWRYRFVRVVQDIARENGVVINAAMNCSRNQPLVNFSFRDGVRIPPKEKWIKRAGIFR